MFLVAVTASSAQTPARAAFVLASQDVAAGSTIGEKFVFKGMGCQGENVTPSLNWSGAPPGTASFVLSVFDPDARGGAGWWHWIVYNLPAEASALPQDAGNPQRSLLPKPAWQAKNDFGQTGYGGPCPPPGERPHHYVFTIYALRIAAVKPPDDRVGYIPTDAVLAKASFTAVYGRPSR